MYYACAECRMCNVDNFFQTLECWWSVLYMTGSYLGHVMRITIHNTVIQLYVNPLALGGSNENLD